MKYMTTIGLEIHVELNTKTKMYCSCKNDPFRSSVNSNVCPICLGLPGSLPVVNKKAVLDTIKIGKALDCKIAKLTKWDRKHYFYPDLPKNYQISQFDMPLCQGGYLELPSGKKIKLTRIHLEEDTGKLLHYSGKYSLIDLNRAGAPLVELVTEPVIRNGQEARQFCEEYQLILRYLKVSKADMEKGEMRCEANISISAGKKLGTKVEVKNLNSFKAVEKAINYEAQRQTEALESGRKVIQETRGWNDSKQKTYTQRVKETSADYRYFPEPDIPPIETNPLVSKIKKLPELPTQKRARYQKWGIADKDIKVIISNPKMSEFFELTSHNTNDKKIMANLLINEVPNMKLKPNDLAYVANLMDSGKINRIIAKRIFFGICQGKKVSQLLKQYQTIDDIQKLKKIVQQVIKDNPKVVEKIKKGKTSAIQHLIGQVMAKTRGQADPQKVGEILRQI